MSKSRIEWTDEVWNPVTGCTKVSAGCKHCYAEREWPRLTRLVPAYEGRPFTDVRCQPERLDQPLRWQKPRKVFVNSMSDLFHEAVPEDFILSVFVTMAAARQHTFQVLTKRADRMRDLLTRWRNSGLMLREGCGVSLRNVWLGVSIEDQATADERIPLLLDTPASVRWSSAEPLLGAVDLVPYMGFRTIECGCGFRRDEQYLVGASQAFEKCLLCMKRAKTFPSIDWVVVGGESGPKARPMHPDWVRSLRDQCATAGVPFLFKQWGEYCGDRDFRASAHKWEMIDRSGRTLEEAGSTANMGPITHVARVGKKAAGRLLDGVQHDGYPGGAA